MVLPGHSISSQPITPDETIQEEHQLEKPGGRKSSLPAGGSQAIGKWRIPGSNPEGELDLPTGVF